ncbi:MAG: transglycosylase SLT domain-containing protein [Bacteroidetes bacterium]|nr:transglycosylase SLT domain-containing protein [Bacteroidota bacterium]
MKNVWNQVFAFLRRWHRHLLALPALFLLMIFIKLFNFSSGGQVSDEDYRSYFVANYKVFGITIPKDLNFCGEQVPVNDFTVREALERELLVNTYWQSQTVLFHKKANRWFPVIEPILKRNGLPDDLKYVVVVESGFSNVVSPQQAAGFWQFVPGTAEHYGLEISEEVDERYNVEKATQAACELFKDAYKRYNNWTLAAASYNLGMGGVDKQLEKQKSGSYYDLYLNEETARYIYRILAVKEILSRPKAYGYQLRAGDLYPPIPTYAITVDSSITDLAAFAIKQKSTYKILKLMNPWLLKSSLNNPNKKKYTLLFPRNGVKLYGLDEQAETGSTIDSSKYVTPNDVLADSLSRTPLYTVQEGDTWDKLAQRFGMRADELIQANKADAKQQPVRGTQLVIPKR